MMEEFDGETECRGCVGESNERERGSRGVERDKTKASSPLYCTGINGTTPSPDMVSK